LHDDTKPSFSPNRDTGLWYCHSGCGGGNIYQLAVALNMDNPHQYIPPSMMDSKKRRTNGHEPNNALKSENEQTIDVDKTVKYVELKNRYGERVELEETYKNKYIGKNDNGETVFIYPKGIKIHKKYWIDDASLNKSCQIFMAEEMSSFDKSKPLIIYEGEKDAIASFKKGISFSAGAGAIPDDITPLYDFPEIIISYDNDKAGYDGAERLAERIKKESPSTIVKIIQWDTYLPKGYDVCDDGEKTGFAEFEDAVVNATEYTITIPKQLKGFKIMSGKEASNTTPKPTKWIIENVLPKGFNSCIAGTTGSKKSMWAIQLALSVANGEKEFCNNPINTRGLKVLFIDTEIGEDELLRRFHKIKSHMAWKGDGNWLMMSKSGTTMDIWEQTKEMIAAFRPELVVIDSMYNATSVADFSKPTGMSKVTDALSIIKDKYKVTLLMVAHFNKGGHELGLMIDRMQGSAVFQNWIEFQILMIKTNIQDFNIWRVAKTRGVFHDESYIGLQWDDFWFTAKGVIEDINPYLITEQKKRKWMTILEDCPQKFDTNQWLNVFNSKFPEMSERTAKTWLKEASGTPMLKKVLHGVYEKNLELLDETINED
jgi:KaiC/GvpD/RAD55 family RecA-like ATPase